MHGRGLLWAHYRIIREFAYFDPEVLYQAQRQTHTPIINHAFTLKDTHDTDTDHPSTPPASAYVVRKDGSMYKNGIPFLDTDILTIFEDDAESAVVDLKTPLIGVRIT
jgi:hypothetical protein